MNKEFDIRKNKHIIKIFLSYTIPTMIGMMSISSSSIVDGIFVGRFIGSHALAVINLVIPYVSILLGIITMLGAGGCVLCGRLIGEKNENKASHVFSKIVLIMAIITIVIALIVLMFPYNIANLLGANQDVMDYTVQYITLYSYFLPFQLLGIGLSFFARVNGRPGLASFALLLGAIMNIVLDYVLVVIFKQGISGVALATGISQSMTFFILLPSFFRKNSVLRFVKPKGSTKEIYFSMYNGLSELLNETSSGIVAFTLNHILILQSGINGVAAFTIVNYFLYSGCLVAYSVAASIHGPVSINYGAKDIKRTHGFLKVALVFSLILGVVIAAILVIFSNLMMRAFLGVNDLEIEKLSIRYIRLIWPAFIISGLNIVISGYFTSIQKPIQSLVFSALRSLLLPVGFILVINYFFNNELIFSAIPLAELITLIIIMIYTRMGTHNIS